MTAMVPTITALYAALLGLLGAALTINAIVNRVRAKVDTADGGVATLAQAIRAHANFAEHAPIALIVIGLAEVLGTRPLIVHMFGRVLVLARLASAIGLNRTLKQSPPRQLGASGTILVLIAASLAILLALAGIR
ncbi:MAG: MAPEG family protein [Xanthobacteraceae bacterium]|nr:MAPEG family protein [Xanthobacteraceae bacterium]